MGLVACNNDDAPESTLPEGKGKTVTVTIKGNKADSRALNDGNAFTANDTKANISFCHHLLFDGCCYYWNRLRL